MTTLPPNELDQLLREQDVRVREVSLMLPTDGPLTVEQLNEVRQAVLRHIKRRGISQELLAQKIGSNNTYVSNFLSGQFAAIPEQTRYKLARQLNDWLELDAARARQESGGALVHTKVAQRLIKVARQIAEVGDMAIAHGPAGCGKTATLLELLRLIPASMYIYITPQRGKPSGFLRALYEAVWEHRSPKRPTLEDALDRLRMSDRLLMLDNADQLDPAVYPTLMALHDEAKIPVLIVGTYKLLAKLDHDADPLRGQMSSRIGLRAELLREVTAPRGRGRPEEWITADEVRQIFERGRVKLHRDATAELKRVANHEIGLLRRCARYLRYAVRLAGTRGDTVVTLHLLRKAMGLVDGLTDDRSPGAAAPHPEEATA